MLFLDLYCCSRVHITLSRKRNNLPENVLSANLSSRLLFPTPVKQSRVDGCMETTLALPASHTGANAQWMHVSKGPQYARTVAGLNKTKHRRTQWQESTPRQTLAPCSGQINAAILDSHLYVGQQQHSPGGSQVILYQLSIKRQSRHTF